MTDVNIVLLLGGMFTLYLVLVAKGRPAPLAVLAVFATLVTQNSWYAHTPLWTHVLQWVLVLVLVLLGQIFFWAQGEYDSPHRMKVKVWLSRVTNLIAALAAYVFPLLFSGASSWTVMIILGIAVIAIFVGGTIAALRRIMNSRPRIRQRPEAPTTPAGPRASDLRVAPPSWRGAQDPGQVRRQRPTATSTPRHHHRGGGN